MQTPDDSHRPQPTRITSLFRFALCLSLSLLCTGRGGSAATASVGSNPRFAKMMDKSDALAPLRGVDSGNRFDSLIGDGLRGRIGMKNRKRRIEIKCKL